MTPPGEVYGRALAQPGARVRARFSDGAMRPLELGRWLGPATPEEREALHWVAGPVLDVGCGAGRHLVELRRRGVPVLGIDIIADAVDIARRRRGAVLRRSVFAPLPGEGRWGSALLLDGNVGIGGDAAALLRRMARLLRPGGRVVAELEPPQASGGAFLVRVEGSAGTSEWFPWARLSATEIEAVARRCGFSVIAAWEAAGRCFCVAERAAGRVRGVP